MDNTPCGTALKNWKTGGIKNDVAWVVTTLGNWGACVIDDGTLVDSHTGKKLHGNHVRCLLRREYQRQDRELRGRSLDVMLDAAIAAIVRVNRQVIEQRRGKVSETVLDVVDSFL